MKVWDSKEDCKGSHVHDWITPTRDRWVWNVEYCGWCSAVRPKTWEQGDVVRITRRRDGVTALEVVRAAVT